MSTATSAANAYGAFIVDDGYTESGYLRELPRMCPALSFTYRPMTGAQRRRFLFDQGKLAPEEQDLHAAKSITRHIQSWDLLDKAGNPAKVSANVYQRLKPALQDRLQAIVTGLDTSDALPTDEQLADKLDAASTDTAIGDVTQEREAKN